MVILARYSPRSRDIRTQHTPLAKEAMPATGLAIQGEQAAQAGEHAYHHHKDGEEPGDAVIRRAVQGGGLDAVDSPDDADLVGDQQRQHGRNNQRNKTSRVMTNAAEVAP